MEAANTKIYFTQKQLTIIMVSTVFIGLYSFGQNKAFPPPITEEQAVAIDDCIAENHLPIPDSGARPTKEQMHTLHKCLQKKGISLPHPNQRPVSEE